MKPLKSSKKKLVSLLLKRPPQGCPRGRLVLPNLPPCSLVGVAKIFLVKTATLSLLASNKLLSLAGPGPRSNACHCHQSTSLRTASLPSLQGCLEAPRLGQSIKGKFLSFFCPRGPPRVYGLGLGLFLHFLQIPSSSRFVLRWTLSWSTPAV